MQAWCWFSLFSYKRLCTVNFGIQVWSTIVQKFIAILSHLLLIVCKKLHLGFLLTDNSYRENSLFYLIFVVCLKKYLHLLRITFGTDVTAWIRGCIQHWAESNAKTNFRCPFYLSVNAPEEVRQVVQKNVTHRFFSSRPGSSSRSLTWDRRN